MNEKILNWILGKQEGKVWTEFNWLLIHSSNKIFWWWWWTSRFHMQKEFHNTYCSRKILKNHTVGYLQEIWNTTPCICRTLWFIFVFEKGINLQKCDNQNKKNIDKYYNSVTNLKTNHAWVYISNHMIKVIHFHYKSSNHLHLPYAVRQQHKNTYISTDKLQFSTSATQPL